MKKCPNGHEVSDKMKFCPECGAEVKEGSKKICKKCGNEQKDGEKFCSQCGTPFVADRVKVNSKSKKTIIASLIALFVIFVGCCLWYFNGNKYGRYSLEGLAKVTYKYDCCGDFHEGMAMVRKGDKIGYIDRMGNEVIPCIYDEIIPSRDDMVLDGNNFYFHDGLALVCKDGKYFFINKEGKEAFPFKYELAKDFSEGLAVVYKDGKYGFIDTKGNEVIPLTDKVYGGFSEGLSVVQKGNKYGYIDKSGRMAIPIQFETDEYGYGASPFMNGLAVIIKNGKRGYIDKNGKEVIPCIYDIASDFSEGLALVRNGEGRAGYIDKKGNEVIPCSYERAEDFSEGLAFVSKEEIKFFINTKGEKVFSCTDFSGDGFHDGFASVGNGFIDKHGKEIVQRIYRQVFGFSEGLAAVCKDGVWGYIDTKGKSTFDVMSEEIKAQIKENKRIEEEKRKEEERRIKEEERRRGVEKVVTLTYKRWGTTDNDCNATGNYGAIITRRPNHYAVTDYIEIPNGKVWVFDGYRLTQGSFFTDLSLMYYSKSHGALGNRLSSYDQVYTLSKGGLPIFTAGDGIRIQFGGTWYTNCTTLSVEVMFKEKDEDLVP